MTERKKYNPVRPITAKGKLLTGIVRALYGARRTFGGKDWEYVLQGHHEDPLKMNAEQRLYLGHKYYYRALLNADENSGLEKHFRENAGTLQVPGDFRAHSTVTLSAGGDLMPYFCITEKTCADLWKETGDFFFGADIVTANLETPVDTGKRPYFVPEVMLSNMYFNGGEEMFSVFSGMGKYRGYDFLSTANNHSLDMGEDGVHATLSFLEKKNILSAGTASSEKMRDEVKMITRNGVRIAFLSFTFSLNREVCPPGKEYLVNHLNLNEDGADISAIVSQAKNARAAGADFLVAALHMGCAYQPYPSQTIVDNMRRICRETGIDVVLGGHPHNPQPMEFIEVTDPFSGEKKNSFVIYSFGDFVAYDIFKWCRLPLMMKFSISKGTCGGKEKTILTGVEAKFVYNRSVTKRGNVEKLEFLDFSMLRNDDSVLDDAASKEEFRELRWFAETFLLPGNLEKFLV
ncbi:MAG TPA: CapA family protein [Bacteroidia bacterium]|nr:CapA family protein [Bacteroidia bacterium]